MAELKPCPFCGSAAEDTLVSNYPHQFVHCSNLDCKAFFTEFRVPEWNHRTPDKEP